MDSNVVGIASFLFILADLDKSLRTVTTQSQIEDLN
jgi:hypothetical protein